MEDYSRGKTMNLYLNKINSGKMEFSKLRNALNNERIDPDEITIIIRQIDRELIRMEQIKASHSLGKNLFYGGLLLFAVGLTITIGTFSGLINLGNHFLIAIGPICGGWLLQ